jgi:hypothetical protein
VKRFGILLAYVVGFITVLMILTPKVNLYYLIETQIKPFGIIIDGEHAEDRGFTLRLSDGTLYAKQIETARVDTLDAGFFGLYNYISVSKVRLADTFEKLFPTEITSIRVTYAVWNPLAVTLDAEGDFGTARATLTLTDRTLNAVVTPSKLMSSRYQNTLRRLKKDETGGYRYETRF